MVIQTWPLPKLTFGTPFSSTWGLLVSLLFCTLYEAFLSVTYGLRPSLLVPLPGQSWVKPSHHNQLWSITTQPSKLFPPISLLSPNWDDRTYVLKSFVIILRSSAPPSLRLDTRVGSNWVLKHTIYLSFCLHQHYFQLNIFAHKTSI